MCQLLGVCANRELDIRFSFREWRHRGDDNPHGYGFAHWAGGELRVEKAASSLVVRADSDLEVTAARSPIFLAHVRLASVGRQDGVNTHPFEAMAGGRTFAFAHNGTLRKAKLPPLRQRVAGGETDSEHAFLLLLEEAGGASGGQLDRALKAAADGLRSRYAELVTELIRRED